MQKKSIQIIAITVLVLVALAGVYAGFTNGSGKSFKESFKEGFLRGCIDSEASQEKIELCHCSIDEALKQLSIRELRNKSRTQKYIKEVILPSCIENTISPQEQ